MSATPVLHTARLTLEPVRPEHAQEVWPQLDDDRMWQYFPALRPATVDDLRRLYEKWQRGSPSDEQVWCNWLCRERSAGVLAASLQATVFPSTKVSYIAYAVYPQHQRKGYAREAAQAVMTYVEKAYGVDRFFAEMDMRNEPSYRLAESLGFVRVETRESENEYVYELAR